MNFKERIATALLALQLSGCPAPQLRPAVPRFELAPLESKSASGEEIVKSNYEKATGTTAPMSSEAINGLYKTFAHNVTTSASPDPNDDPKTGDLLNSRELVLRTAQAVSLTTVVEKVLVDDKLAGEAVERGINDLAKKGESRSVVLTELARYAAAAPDLVTAKVNEDFSQSAVYIRGKQYHIQFDGDAARDDVTVHPPGTAAATLDLTRRIVAGGSIDVGSLIVPSCAVDGCESCVSSYVIGTDLMSEELVEKLNFVGIKATKGDKVDFYSGKVRTAGGEQERTFAAVNKRTHSTTRDLEKEAFYAAQVRQSLLDAEKGDVTKAIALSAEMQYEKPAVNNGGFAKVEDYQRRVADKALSKLKLKVAVGATAMTPEGERSVGLVREIDANFSLNDAYAGDAVSAAEALELINERQQTAGTIPLVRVKGRTGMDSYALNARTTVLSHPHKLFEGYVTAGGKRVNGFDELTPGLDKTVLDATHTAYTLRGRAYARKD